MIVPKTSPFVICLMGPTGSGKTGLAIELVKHLPCEIISVDSAMVYRGMDIGTAKPSAAELAQAPHHLIDICDPAQAYSAGQFQRDATREINNCGQRERVPLLVGGTMLYFRAWQQGLSELPTADPQIRAELQQDLEKRGVEQLHERLYKIDPTAAARIKPTDPQRIIRALEVYIVSGKPLSEFFTENPRPAVSYQNINIAIAPKDRVLLHERIAKRFQQMMADGLCAEVEALFNRGDLHEQCPSMRSVGYRQVWQYLSGQLNYAECIEKSIIATRQLAKRQMTWLRSWPDLHLFDSEDPKLVQNILQFLEKRFKIANRSLTIRR
jgi:tRNA dimethylallyltransferase